MAVPPVFDPAPDPVVPQVEIDPGEALYCMTGLGPMLNDERISAGQVRDALSIGPSVERLARRLVRGESFESAPRSNHSYKTMLDRLTSGLTDLQTATALSKVPDAHVAMAWLHVSKQVYDFLSARFPKVPYVGVVSTVNLEPSDTEWWEFQDTFTLLNDPLSVFLSISDGSVLPSEIAMLELLVPSVLEAIRLAVDAALTVELSRLKSFELPVSVEFGVATLRGAPIEATPYQDAYIVQSATRDIAPTPSKAKSPLAAESESGVERALFHSVGAS